MLFFWFIFCVECMCSNCLYPSPHQPDMIHPVAATLRVASFLLCLKVLLQILASANMTLVQS